MGRMKSVRFHRSDELGSKLLLMCVSFKVILLILFQIYEHFVRFVDIFLLQSCYMLHVKKNLMKNSLKTANKICML